MTVAAQEAALLDATAAVVADVGLEGATVDAIAQRAGVNKAAVYDHVGSKADLIARAVAREIQRLTVALDRSSAAHADPPPAPDGESARHLLRHRVGALLHHAATDPTGARFLLATRGSRAPEHQAQLDALRSLLIGRLADGLRSRYAEAGRPIDRAADVLAALSMAVVESATQAVLDDPTIDVDATTDAVVDLLQGGLRAIDPRTLDALDRPMGVDPSAGHGRRPDR